MKAIPWKTLLPVIVALAVFYALSLAYFSPVMEGLRLRQGDLRNWQGMAQEIQEHRDLQGEEPLWTGSMFSGMPAYQVSVVWPNNLLMLADEVFHGFLPRPASFLFLYLLGMYVLLRCLRIDPWLSIVGAVAFGFSSYFFAILEAGHNSKANAIGYMPMVLGAVYLLYRDRMLLGGALLALFLGLEIAMNHVQITYYLALLVGLFVLAEAVRAFREKALPDFVKRSSLGVVGMLLALCCNIGMLWTTWEYGNYSTRGKSELTIKPDGSSAADIRTAGLDRDYVTGWSYGKQEAFSLLFPDAKGGATAQVGNDPSAMTNADPRFRQNLAQMNRYWGDQSFTSGPVYLGAIVVLLMLLMLGRVEGLGRWWVLGSIPLVIALIAIANSTGEDVLAQGTVLGLPASLVSGVLLIGYLVAGLFLVRDTLVYALFGGLLLTLLLSFGRNLMPLTDFFLEHVPGYNKFRAVTIIMVIVELAAPVLAVLYLDRLLREGKWEKAVQRRFLIISGTLLLVLLAFVALPETFFSFVSDAERNAFGDQASDPKMEAQVVAFVGALKDMRIGFFNADVMRSFAFVLIGALLVFLYGRGVLSKSLLLGGLGLVILVDLWAVDKRYVNNEKQRGRYVAWEEEKSSELPFTPSAADLAILQDEWSPSADAAHTATMERIKAARKGESGRGQVVSKEEEMVARFGDLRRNSDFRVITLSNPFNDSKVSYFHKSLGGYHGAKLKRYQELIEFQLGASVQRVGALLQSGTSMPVMDSLLAREGVLNMLNARYLIYSPERPPIRNTNALGSGWFVDEVQWVKDGDAEITALGTIDPARTALVDERYRSALGDAKATADPSASVELDSYATDELQYTVRSAQGGVVVFSEIWYGPDWKAFIDDVPTEHARADYVLRAMTVPAGEHKVVFRVEGKAYRMSQPIGLAGSGLVLLLVLGALWIETRPAKAAA